MVKKIPNGKEIIRQEIEKRMWMLEELSNRVASQELQDGAQHQIAPRGRRRQVGIIQEDISNEEKERIVDELVKCGNKSFFFDEFEDGVLQDSAQHQIVIPHGKVYGRVDVLSKEQLK